MFRALPAHFFLPCVIYLFIFMRRIILFDEKINTATLHESNMRIQRVF